MKRNLLPEQGKQENHGSPFAEIVGSSEESQEEFQYPHKRKHRKVKFHDTYTQFTSYIHLQYEEPLEELMEMFEEGKAALFNEALYELFKKYREQLANVGIDVDKLPPHPEQKKYQR